MRLEAQQAIWRCIERRGKKASMKFVSWVSKIRKKDVSSGVTNIFQPVATHLN
jgi:hypothetical protein